MIKRGSSTLNDAFVYVPAGKVASRRIMVFRFSNVKRRLPPLDEVLFEAKTYKALLKSVVFF